MNKNKYVKILSIVLLAVVLTFVVRNYMIASYVVDGESMEPTLYDGNLLMVNKVIYDLKEADRFDVIVFHANEQDDYVKRIIGLPGDEIEYENDRLHINGEYIEEDFLNAFKQASGEAPFTKDFSLEDSTGKTKVPPGKLFVLGDNRRDSLDSRSFGFISATSLVGKVDIKYWPLSQAQLSFGN